MSIYNIIYLVWWGLAYGPRNQHLLAVRWLSSSWSKMRETWIVKQQT